MPRPLLVQAFKYKVTCPRWALPAEEVPIHVQFDKSLTPLLRSVDVALHESLAFRDLINMTDYRLDGRALTVNSIGKSTRSEYDYFGFAVATTSPFEELEKAVPVKIKFNYRGGSSETHTEYARIFRPRLELGASPDRISITDSNTDRLELPIALKFSGFGQIKVAAECRIGGSTVSFASSMLAEGVRKIAKGRAAAGADAGAGASIGPGGAEQTTARISGLLENRGERGRILGELGGGGGGGGGGGYANVLRVMGQESKEEFPGMLYSTAGAYAAQATSEIADRNVGENMTMEPTSIHVQISRPVTKAAIRLHYRDLAGNVYGPVVKEVEIVDKRKNPAGPGVRMQIKAKSVDEKMAYKNVSAMEIGADE